MTETVLRAYTDAELSRMRALPHDHECPFCRVHLDFCCAPCTSGYYQPHVTCLALAQRDGQAVGWTEEQTV